MNVTFPIALGSFRRPGQVFVVDPDGRGDYKTIGAAVADVEAQGSHFLFGATTRPVILVMPGLYEESPFVVPPSVNLVGVVPSPLSSQNPGALPIVLFTETAGDLITLGDNATL